MRRSASPVAAAGRFRQLLTVLVFISLAGCSSLGTDLSSGPGNKPGPPATQQASITAAGAGGAAAAGSSSYAVQTGDSLAGIAVKNGVSIDELPVWIALLRQINGIPDFANLEAGSVLTLPTADSLAEAVAAERASVPPTPNPTSIDGRALYDVQQGDSLASIAAGLKVPDGSVGAWLDKVMQINNLGNLDHIEPGQTLELPDDIGTPALTESTASPTTGTNLQASAPPGENLPVIRGKSAAIIDAGCGELLYGINAHERLPPASLTKIVTALVTVQRSRLDAIVMSNVSAKAMAQEGDSVMGLEPGMQLSVRDLLYGLLLPSGNDSAQTLASYVAGSVPAFVDLMNEEVASLGLTDTHLTNPDGLDDPDLYSSAYDMAEAGRALLANPLLAQIVATTTYMPDWLKPALQNDNKLLTAYPGTYGVKIGYDDKAEQTIVAAAARNGRLLIVSVFGSKDRFADAVALFNWGFANLTDRCP